MNNVNRDKHKWITDTINSKNKYIRFPNFVIGQQINNYDLKQQHHDTKLN